MSHLRRRQRLPDIVVRGLVAEGRTRQTVQDEVFGDILGECDAAVLENKIRPLDVSTLLIWGERDQVVDVSTAASWKKLNQKIELHILPRVGHSVRHQRSTEIGTYLRPHVLRD